MSIAEPKLMTIDEFSKLDVDDRKLELVRGKVVEMNLPKPRHGQICSKVNRVIGNFADEHELGHVVTNDTGVITERNPDSLRGPDIAFFSYARVPKGPLPTEYLQVVPEVAFEVLSPDDRWSKVTEKIAEYLNAGVLVVCVLDPATEIVHVHRADDGPVQLSGDDEMALPEFSDELKVPVRRFFE